MIPDWIEEIRRDNLSGAAELAAGAARALAEWAPERTPDEIAAVLRALVAAQPRMAPMLHLAGAVLAKSGDPAAACQEFLARLEAAAEVVAERAATLVHDGDVVASHSRSSSVLNALRRARLRGKRFSVYLTESRPAGEGVALAGELAAQGIPVRLFVDAALGQIASEARIVLVGADAVTRDGVINKIGTWPLALAARERAVPVYALVTTDKFVPDEYELPAEPPRDPTEVLSSPPVGVEAVNWYFEATPLDLFQALVTEEGMLGAESARRRLAALRLPAGLRRG